MDKLKQQIEQQLKANVLISKCVHCNGIIFRDAWCTQSRVIRFTIPYFRELFPCVLRGKGCWESGDSIMFEANNTPYFFIVNCVYSPASSDYASMITQDKLLNACDIESKPVSFPVILRSWDISAPGEANKLFEAFDRFLAETVPAFGNELREKINGSETTVMKEGAVASVISSKYERNPKAREACLAVHGTACMVCGIDFGKEYGPEFNGQIEVHHIVPLNQIGKEYVVDPVHDLVPVCPNCHTALHSKKDGVYTVEELKALRQKNTGII